MTTCAHIKIATPAQRQLITHHQLVNSPSSYIQSLNRHGILSTFLLIPSCEILSHPSLASSLVDFYPSLRPLPAVLYGGEVRGAVAVEIELQTIFSLPALHWVLCYPPLGSRWWWCIGTLPSMPFSTIPTIIILFQHKAIAMLKPGLNNWFENLVDINFM